MLYYNSMILKYLALLIGKRYSLFVEYYIRISMLRTVFNIFLAEIYFS